MGGSLDVTFGMDDQTQAKDLTLGAAVRGAQWYLPLAWVTSSNEHERRMEVRWDPDRGKYRHTVDEPPRSLMIISPSQGNGLAEGEATVIHELVHRAERTHDGIQGAEWAFYTARTTPYDNAKDEELKSLRLLTNIEAYKDDEVTREDDFQEAYSGKSYAYGSTEDMQNSYEILSMGIEGLFAGNMVLRYDEEYRQFVLGSLALL
jgi:hypothetical protein